jgi:hypothetical protein
MNQEQVATVNEVFQKFTVDKPSVKLETNPTYDEPAILIGDGFLMIRPIQVEVKSIGKTRLVPGYVLEMTKYYPSTQWQPEEYDYAEVTSDRRFDNIVVAALKTWVAKHAEWWLEADGLAKMEQV